MRYLPLLLCLWLCTGGRAPIIAQDTAAFKLALRNFDDQRDDTSRTKILLAEIDALKASIPAANGKYLRRRAYDAFSRKDVAEGTRLAEEAIAALYPLDDWLEISEVYHLLSYEALQRKEYPEVIRYAQLQLDAARKAGDLSAQASAYEKIGLANVDTSNFDGGKENYEKGIALAKAAGNNDQLANLYGNYAYIFRRPGAGNRDSLYYYTKLSLDMEAALPRPDSAKQVYKYMVLGQYLAQKENFDGALTQVARAFAHENGRTPAKWMMELRRFAATVHRRMGDYETARRLFDRALAIEATNSDLNPVWLHYGLMEMYQDLGDIDSVVHYAREYGSAIVRSQLNKRAEAVAELETKYQSREKQAEIDRLALEDQLNRAKLTRQGWIIGGGLALLGLLGSFLYILYQQRSRIQAQNETISRALDEKDTLLKEIHHRVKNNLQMVSSLLSLQSDFIDDDKALDALQMGQRRVRSMAIIHQKLYLRDEVKTDVSAKEYLDQLISELMQTLNVKGVALKMTKRLEYIDLDIDRLIPLGLIANEVITNAMKHAFVNRESGLLSINFQRNGPNIELIIADDGPGLSQELDARSDSFGSLLIQTFAEQLEGKVDVDGTGGTRVALSFPST